MEGRDLQKFIGAKIKEFREDKKITQNDVALFLNTTRQTISRYESGDRAANQDVLFRLASLFNKTVDEFFPPRNNEENKQIETIAAHHDGEEWSEEELEEIRRFKEFVKAKRKI
jgi:transcriptional regulator with XRE-family HTH domain